MFPFIQLVSTPTVHILILITLCIMDLSKYGKHGSSLLLYLLDNREVPITDFSKLHISSHTYYRSLSYLESDGLVKRKERIKGRKLVLYSLTDKGRSVATNLKQAQEVSEGKLTTNENESPVITLSKSDYEKFHQKVRNLSVLSHFNVLDDHIAIRESNYDKKGDDRVVFVYVKLNGNGIMRLWCEEDQSFDCWHVKYAWTLPDVQAMVQYQIRNGNAKGIK